MPPPFDPGAAAAPDSGLFGLLDSRERAKVIVQPVPYAATTSYGGGAERGPAAILQASRQVDLYDAELGRPYEAGIHMLDLPEEIEGWHHEARARAELVIGVGGEVGDDERLVAALAKVNELSGRVNERVHETTRELLAQGKLVALLGGDHATPLGAIRAHAEAHPGLGVLHIDAHADLREAFEGFTYSHASIMHNVLAAAPGVLRIVQVGVRDLCEAEAELVLRSSGRVVTHFDAELAARRLDGVAWSAQAARIVEDLPREVYVSFDIDGLDPTLCPHTGTPVPGGLSFHEAMGLLGAVVRSGRTIVGCDLNEVSPGPEGDEWDANVGARVLYKMIGWMLASQRLITLPPRVGAVPSPGR